MLEWWKGAVVYQIYPRSFCDSNGDGIGDIPGIISKLGYLKELGVDVIWLCPVYASPGIDNGYDISDYRSIAPEYGSMEDFDRLLKEAHSRGIRIIMDLVVNHTSDQHEWFLQSRSSKYNQKRDWYIWRDGFDGHEPNRMGSVFSGSAWEHDPFTGQYYLHLFAKEQPDLNWENPAVRRAVYETMRWWFDKGIDGFRMDVINFISKPQESILSDGGMGADCINGPMVKDYLDEMHREVLSGYDILTVGETPAVDTITAIKYSGYGTGALSMVFQFEHMDIDSGPNGKWNTMRYSLPALKGILSKWQTEMEGKAWNSLFWGNHDQPRAVSRFGDDSAPETWEKSAKMLATCLLMMKGTPYIYQGDEIGMTNLDIRELDEIRDIETFNAYRDLVDERHIYTHDVMMRCIRKAGRDNARSPMQWSGSENAGFTTGIPWIKVNGNYCNINTETQMGDPDSVFNYYKKLIQLRKKIPLIVHGRFEPLIHDDTRLFAYRRRDGDESLLVVCNFTGETVDDADIQILMPQQAEFLIGNYNNQTNQLRPYEAVVYLGRW